jgi:N-glycosylase/DNA lyase
MIQYSKEKLSKAVACICPDIRARVGEVSKPLDERCLWWELSSCILSSQVPYTLAVAAANAIDAEGLLLKKHNDNEVLLKRLIRVLNTPLIVGGRPRKYRFPVARAHHLAATRAVINAENCSLHELVGGFRDASVARAWFVKHAPGVGPKQASMFLRNAGVSYDLAILDRHVLNYMSTLGIYSGAKPIISGLAQYRRHEDELRDHAQELNCQVGLLDWAIWIVMRVANRSMEPVTV